MAQRTRAANLVLVCAVLATVLRECKAAGSEDEPARLLASEELPFVVSIQDLRNGSDARDGHICGGTLIAPEWVLTAAECAAELDVGQLGIIAGEQALEGEAATTRRISRVAEVVLHEYSNENDYSSFDEDHYEQYIGVPFHNVALLRLSTPIYDIEPINVLAAAAFEIDNKGLTIAEWQAGADGDGDDLDYSPHDFDEAWGAPLALHTSNQTILNLLACSEMPNAPFARPTTELCVLPAGNGSSCTSDLGGPIFYNGGEGRYFQVGIVQSSRERCGRSVPSAIVRLSSYEAWLLVNVPSLSREQPTESELVVDETGQDDDDDDTADDDEETGRYMDTIVAGKGKLRLVGSNPGRIMYYSESTETWGTVCDSNFTDAEAEAICLELNFLGGRFRWDLRSTLKLRRGTANTAMQVSCPNTNAFRKCTVVETYGYQACRHRNDVILECLDTLPEVPAQDPIPSPSQRRRVRLTGGSALGRLETTVGHEPWGTVCARGGDPDAIARLACHDLGFDGGASVGTVGGPTDGFIRRASAVACEGNEASFGDCTFATATGICTHAEDLLVSCYNGDPEDPILRLESIDGVVAPARGAAGRLLLSKDAGNTWAAVCTTDFTSLAAKVACRQLDSSYKYAVLSHSTKFAESSEALTVAVERFGCLGDEQNLWSCPRPDDVAESACFANTTVVIACSAKKIAVKPGAKLVPVEGFESLSKNVEVGRLEVSSGGLVFGSVPGGYMHSEAVLNVACRSIKSKYAYGALVDSAYTCEPSPALDYVSCNGDEDNLFECSHVPSSGFCTYAAILACSTKPLDTTVTLEKPKGANVPKGLDMAGMVRVSPSGLAGGTICADYFGDQEARVVCKMLGFDYGVVLDAYTSDDPLAISYMSCEGSEADISECFSENYGSCGSNPMDRAAVGCAKKPPPVSIHVNEATWELAQLPRSTTGALEFASGARLCMDSVENLELVADFVCGQVESSYKFGRIVETSFSSYADYVTVACPDSKLGSCFVEESPQYYCSSTLATITCSQRPIALEVGLDPLQESSIVQGVEAGFPTLAATGSEPASPVRICADWQDLPFDAEAALLCAELGFKFGISLGPGYAYDYYLEADMFRCNEGASKMHECVFLPGSYQHCETYKFNRIACSKTRFKPSVSLGDDSYGYATSNALHVGLAQISPDGVTQTEVAAESLNEETIKLLCKAYNNRFGFGRLIDTVASTGFTTQLACSGSESSIFDCPRYVSYASDAAVLACSRRALQETSIQLVAPEDVGVSFGADEIILLGGKSALGVPALSELKKLTPTSVGYDQPLVPLCVAVDPAFTNGNWVAWTYLSEPVKWFDCPSWATNLDECTFMPSTHSWVDYIECFEDREVSFQLTQAGETDAYATGILEVLVGGDSEGHATLCEGALTDEQVDQTCRDMGFAEGYLAKNSTQQYREMPDHLVQSVFCPIGQNATDMSKCSYLAATSSCAPLTVVCKKDVPVLARLNPVPGFAGERMGRLEISLDGGSFYTSVNAMDEAALRLACSVLGFSGGSFVGTSPTGLPWSMWRISGLTCSNQDPVTSLSDCQILYDEAPGLGGEMVIQCEA